MSSSHRLSIHPLVLRTTPGHNDTLPETAMVTSCTVCCSWKLESIPEASSELIKTTTAKRATCRKYSTFASARLRIAVVTAHFGEHKEHYEMVRQTHLLHALVHGTEVRVMWDPIVDDLWNKPAFILELLMREMVKPEKERLEWIQWVDRDTLVLDQCRPISSFLPPEETRSNPGWYRDDRTKQVHPNTTNLHVAQD
ncbi:hypothetical protein ACJQWK_05773 [Exserohilum turcicum]